MEARIAKYALQHNMVAIIKCPSLVHAAMYSGSAAMAKSAPKKSSSRDLPTLEVRVYEGGWQGAGFLRVRVGVEFTGVIIGFKVLQF